ncbi:MAG: hypothetical protein FWH23_06875 [Bacteroidales bacterium]|nr:hypothetical protein [Bacteroidales bacterium]MCL2133572.1 hypothetical protein [Bacteroidales bacterium]
MNDEIHIGKLIYQKLKEDGRTASWLAKQIYCSRTHIYKLFKKSEIPHPQLVQICIVLEFDFFIHYSNTVNIRYSKKIIKSVANMDTQCRRIGYIISWLIFNYILILHFGTVESTVLKMQLLQYFTALNVNINIPCPVAGREQ